MFLIRFTFLKSQGWIRIRNKLFRNNKTALIYPIFSCVDPILIQIQVGSTTQLSNDDLYLAGLHAELEAAQR